jgi:hypothetical protein
MRTARSRTSGENRFDVFFVMAPPSQAVEPPANPARFSAHAEGQWFIANAYEAARVEIPEQSD